MPKLTNTGELQADGWQVVSKEVSPALADLSSGQWLVHVKWYMENQEELINRDNIGVWLDSDDEAESVSSVVSQLPVMGVNFPVFTDGRGFSIGRTIRERYKFTGELRAIGNFMQDQLFYLKRCGFDAFIVGDDIDATSMSKSLTDFSDAYQASVDQPVPLFRRRLAQ